MTLCPFLYCIGYLFSFGFFVFDVRFVHNIIKYEKNLVLELIYNLLNVTDHKGLAIAAIIIYAAVYGNTSSIDSLHLSFVPEIKHESSSELKRIRSILLASLGHGNVIISRRC